MQHFSFLTFAFLGFSISVISTLFIHHDNEDQVNHYDFSVPEFATTEDFLDSTNETGFLDIRCASSEYCLNALVGNNAVLDNGDILRGGSVKSRELADRFRLIAITRFELSFPDLTTGQTKQAPQSASHSMAKPSL